LAVSQEVSAIDLSVRIAKSGTVEGELREYYLGPQFELVTLAAFACVGLVLAVIGIGSVMEYAVEEQRSNIVLLGGWRLVTAGILLGLCAGYELTRFLACQVSGVSTTDPWTFSAVVSVVVMAGMAACLFSARRAPPSIRSSRCATNSAFEVWLLGRQTGNIPLVP
jgi:putative ABC transport system permease protein